MTEPAVQSRPVHPGPHSLPNSVCGPSERRNERAEPSLATVDGGERQRARRHGVCSLFCVRLIAGPSPFSCLLPSSFQVALSH